MKLCLGCFRQMKDELQVCPFCGYVVGTPAEDEAFLEPGYLLSDRYLIGQVLEHDVVSVTYAAFDTASDMKVKVREYLPTVYASRYNNEPELSVDESSSKAFSDGFNKFVDEAKRLSRGEGGVTLYDCIADNGTAYMILESPDKKKAEAPAAEPHKEEKKDNKLLNIITTAPLWLKILVPAVVVILAVVLIAAGVFKSDEDITESAAEETESAETVFETEATEAPMTVNVPVLNIDDHSYACYFGCESWEQARDYCESVGGHLATISSQEENDALYAFALSCGYDNVYIGYSDIDSEGVWKWVSGEESDYTNWNPGEPNGFTFSENYAVMVDGGYWNDGDYSPRNETGLVSYICEWDYYVSGVENVDADEFMSAFVIPEQTETTIIDESMLPDGDYFVTSYTFADDGLSGDFSVYAYDTYSADFIEFLKVGDTLLDGSVVESIDRDDCRINYYRYAMRDDGNYYLFDDAEVPCVTYLGDYQLPISSEVVVLDNVDPIGCDEMPFYDYTIIYDGISGFESVLYGDNVFGTPDLFIRIEGGQVTIITVNPEMHQPWRSVEYEEPVETTATQAVTTYDIEYIKNSIFAYYAELLGEDCLNYLEIFDMDIETNDHGYMIIVRTTGRSMANVYYSDVDVNTQTGIATDNFGHTWNLSDYQ